jgi:hypothetical protein
MIFVCVTTIGTESEFQGNKRFVAARAAIAQETPTGKTILGMSACPNGVRWVSSYPASGAKVERGDRSQLIFSPLSQHNQQLNKTKVRSTLAIARLL